MYSLRTADSVTVMQHYWGLIRVQCAVPHAIKAFRNNVFTRRTNQSVQSGTFKSFSKNNPAIDRYAIHFHWKFLSTGYGTVWDKGAAFLGTQCVLRGPRWRLGMGGGRGVLLGGGFHLRHHQELRHLPSGPHGGIWGDQQSGLVDRFHLRVRHDVQWWANKGENTILKHNDARRVILPFFSSLRPQVLFPQFWRTALGSSWLSWLGDHLFLLAPLLPALPHPLIKCTSPMG